MGRTTPTTSSPAPADGHRSSERRSLAMHRLIAGRLDEEALSGARDRVDGWLRDGGPVDAHWARRWATLLGGTVPVVAEALARDDAEMTQLRQTTPFAGALSNADRWRIVRDVR